jgi:hypothetical protein
MNQTKKGNQWQLCMKAYTDTNYFATPQIDVQMD